MEGRVLSKQFQSALCTKLLGLVAKKFRRRKMFDDFLLKYTSAFCINDVFSECYDFYRDIILSHWLLNDPIQDYPLIQVQSIEHPLNKKNGCLRILITQNDMPFLVSSAKMCIVNHGFSILSSYNFVHHNKKQALSYIAVIVSSSSNISDDALIESLLITFRDVSRAVSDWGVIKENMMNASQSWCHAIDKGFISHKEMKIYRDFFEWLGQYFTFLGSRSYRIVQKGKNMMQFVIGSGCGVMIEPPEQFDRPLLCGLPNPINDKQEALFYITKTKTHSTVHRPVVTDMICLRILGEDGSIIGEVRVVGLLTSDAYDSDPTKIPLLREKVEAIEERLQSSSRYSNKLLSHIIKNLPREELFQASVKDLSNIAMMCMGVHESPHPYLYARKDIFDHFYSCILFIPRDKYNTKAKHLIQQELLDFFDGYSAVLQPYYDESSLVRLHFNIQIRENSSVRGDIKELNQRIKDICITWDELWEQSLHNLYSHDEFKTLYKNHAYLNDKYKAIFSPEVSAADIKIFNDLGESKPLVTVIGQAEDKRGFRIRVYQFHQRDFTLQDIFPVLQSFGLKLLYEQSCQCSLYGEKVYISDCHTVSLIETDPAKIELFQSIFEETLSGRCECDILNMLVLSEGLRLQQLKILRCYISYLKQIHFSIDRAMIEKYLTQYSEMAHSLVSYFQDKFGLNASKYSLRKSERNTRGYLDDVFKSDADRALRAIFEAMKATVRTSMFTSEAECLGIKVHSQDVPDMPMPCPMYEIFIYDRVFEGVHLRGGRISRGGIRWSDREDYRTEVAMLAKAQSVKNALIVPAGAKGGFFLKEKEGLCPSEVKALALACYASMMNALLSLTDNYIDQKLICANKVISYDDPDSYLVVAADKGTATYSDYANEIAVSHQFWLKDAFASGGRHGYDHKAMGITAKGAWQSLRWYFHQLSRLHEKPFTVVGIGDMSGDVFGNGMVLSNQIRLIAAFNHRHIFIDPHPDVGISFQERKRLFEKELQWDSYQKELLSIGGGVYDRAEKVIEISLEAMKSLELSRQRLSPNDLIKAILSASVDVIWNGGIGTYVKATDQTQVEVGDMQNVGCRINAHQLRSKVIIEGGNLGLTQEARIEYAQAGGLVNTDFIDNSGGVDCSDHEVNIKIALQPLVDNAEMTFDERNILLKGIEGDVEKSVLQHNIEQNISLSILQRYGSKTWSIKTLIDELVKVGGLDIDDECLPSHDQLEWRQSHNQGLTRPELAVILSYGKLYLKSEIEKMSLIDNELVESYLYSYFPKQLGDSFSKAYKKHPLRQSIVAMMITNRLVSDVGLLFIFDLINDLDCSLADIVLMYIHVRDIYNLDKLLPEIQKAIWSLGPKDGMDLIECYQQAVKDAIRWLLSMGEDVSVRDGFIEYLHVNGCESYEVQSYLSKASQTQITKPCYLLRQVLSDGLAVQGVERVFEVRYRINIDFIAFMTGKSQRLVTEYYFGLIDQLNITWLRKKIHKHTGSNQWDRMQKGLLRSGCDASTNRLVINICERVQDDNVILQQSIKQWLVIHKRKVDNWKLFVADLMASGRKDLAILHLANRRLENFVSVITDVPLAK